MAAPKPPPDWVLVRIAKDLAYDPEAGAITWTVRTGSRTAVGRPAGVFGHGYQYVSLSGDGKRVLVRAHHIAYFKMIGAWPTSEIDHANRNPSDNRWCNLRVATRQQNTLNANLRSDNSSGVKGVSWHRKKQKWFAQIQSAPGRMKGLGSFVDFADACAVRQAAEQKYYDKSFYCDGIRKNAC